MTLTMKKQTFLNIFSPLLLLGFALNSYAVVTLSTGHVDGFEIHYDPAAIGSEERFGLHIHDESTNTHYEPAEVILQVNEAAYGLQGEVFASASRLGWGSEFGWVLPATQSETVDGNGDPAMLFVGVASDGGGAVWAGNQFKISLISVGANNPGDFAMYSFDKFGSFSNPINTKNGVSSSDVLTVTSLDGHDHWNWAFSSAGLYELAFQASGMLNDVLYVSDIETYTFNVIPEPSSGALLLIGLAGLMATRKRVGLKE
jgi:surface-anchored protein